MTQEQAMPADPFDYRYATISEWAANRPPMGEYQSGAKQPVIPFAPLSREIGVEPVQSAEIREMTQDYQQEIASWVGRVKSPYDLIQRAEGQETPGQVYWASKNRAAQNAQTGIEKALVRDKAGRAAIRRQYKTTLHHQEIAQQRLTDSKSAFDRLKAGEGFSEADRRVVSEMLQELANGLAANLDNQYPGGDIEARITGNSILAVGAGVLDGLADPASYTRLMYAAAGYVRKQEALWGRKLTAIYDFAEAHGFSANPSAEDAA